MRIIRKTPLAKNRKLGISAFVLPVLLATVFLLPGCNMFNKPLSDFLEYWTDVAQISRHSFDGSYPETDGLTNLPAGADRVITCYVINPQNYVLTPSATFASGSLTQGSDYSIEQDASDRTVLRLTLNDSYLQSLDGTGTGISPTVSITEPNSGRNFGSYSVPLRVNSAPDGVKSPVVLRSGSSPETYILCFNMPDATKANGDIETISVDGNSFNRTYTVDMQNGTISGTGTIYTTKNASWQPVVNGAADFIGDESNRFVGINTGIPLSGDTVSFTVTTHDSYGLSTSVEAGATASKLELPTSNPSSGSILQVGNSVTIRHPASSGVNRTLDVHVTDGNLSNVDIQTGNSDVTVTFKASGTYTLSAVAKMTGAADSEEVTFTYTVRASAVYVSEDGDDGASGTEDKPVETLQRAIKLLDEAQFTEGEIVVTGTVATEEVIISTLNGTTGSVTTLMVRGGAAGAKLENTDGRVFTIGTGGILTLGENITLTGINDNDTGGAVYITDDGNVTMGSGSKITRSTASLGGGVYVNGGTFTMESGSEITGSTASLGGGVYVSTGGTFTMKGGTIQGQGNKKEIYSAKTFTITGKPTITNCTITLEQGAYIDVNGLNASDLSNVQLNLPDDFYTENAVLLENAGTKDICGKFSLGNPPPTGVWWIGPENGNGALKTIEGTYDESTNTITVPTMPGNKDELQNTVNGSAESGVKVEITGGGTITVDSTVSVPDGADVAIKPASGSSVDITASGKTTVFDVQAGGTLTLGGGGGTVVVEGDSTASNPTSVEDAVPLVNVSNGGTVTIVDNTCIQNNKAGNGVKVTDGTLIMTGGHITGNTGLYSCGGGVYVSGSTATFEMSGGEISGHDLQLGGSLRQGAGVHVSNGAIFILSGDAEIHDNKAQDGAAVYLINDSKFYMKGGKIYDNYAYGAVGAVYIRAQNIQSAMYMTGGSITNNIAAQSSHAGGIFIENGTFDGTGAKSASITGNKRGGQSGSDKDISMNSYSTYTIGNVTVGVGP